MITCLRYGQNASLQLELPDDAVVAMCAAPRGEPLTDLAAAVDQSLTQPLAYPDLGQAAMPGDKVVIALDQAVPGAPTIVARAIAALRANGVLAQDITMLSAAVEADDPLAQVPEETRSQLVRAVHDPALRESLSYLAASTEALPIYMNRAIHDADLVISVGCLRQTGALGYYGVSSSLFPVFSDVETIERFRSPDSERPQVRKQLLRDAEEAGWLLGAFFAIRVIPGRDDQVLHVLAGAAEAVAAAGQSLYEQAWQWSVDRRADLVVATLSGGPADQTWQNIGRALAAAARCVTKEGDIALCTELEERVGAGVGRLLGSDRPQAAIARLAKHPPADTLAAIELANALTRGKVYLMSRLNDEMVEDLGLLPLQPEQLTRLANRYATCLILANAPYATALPPEEVPTPLEPSPRRRKSKG